jgi:hypothetical protein
MAVCHFLNFICGSLHIDRPFLYSVVCYFTVEVMGVCLFGRSSREFRNRAMFAKWPSYLIFVVLVVLVTGGMTGAASIPLALLVWTLSITSGWFYERYKGINKNDPLWKEILGNCVLTLACSA